MQGGLTSRKRVEEHLSTLESEYDSFPVNQTTLAVPERRYRELRDRDPAERIEAFVEVHNRDREVLHVREDGEPRLPGAHLAPDGSTERLREAVRETAGVTCEIEGIDRATIVGLHNDDDEHADPVYHLVVVFRGQPTSEDAADVATWMARSDGDRSVRFPSQ